jgi:hypothetical protein
MKLTDQDKLTAYNSIAGGIPTHIRSFDDGSGIIYYDNGYIVLTSKPALMTDEPCPIPKSHLYYWQVIRNRPDISTWEQIAEALKAD